MAAFSSHTSKGFTAAPSPTRRHRHSSTIRTSRVRAQVQACYRRRPCITGLPPASVCASVHILPSRRYAIHVSAASVSSSAGEGGAAGPSEIPKVMTAARYAMYGSPREVLRVRADVPVPGGGAIPEDGVLVKVEAAALNASDHKCMAGFYRNTQKRELPVTPGAEISGTVVATGSSAAAREWMGKEVWADVTGLDGAFAEYCACPAALLAPKPSTLSHAEATALPVAGSTSLQALRQVGLSTGEAVLVLGGSTGCGAVGIQIAKALGAATVCTTASAPTHSIIRELGADEIVDYRAVDWQDALQGRKFDVVYDCVGGRSSWVAAKTRGVLADKGRYITIVGDTESRVGEPITPARSLSTIMRLLGRTLRGAVTGQKYNILFKQPSSECLEVLRGWVEEGKLRAVVEKEFGPLVGGEEGEASVLQMFERSMGRAEGRVAGSLAGKLVLLIR